MKNATPDIAIPDPFPMKLIAVTNHTFVSRDGRVWTDYHGPLRERPTTDNGHGYRQVSLWDNGKHRICRISNLIAKTFLTKPHSRKRLIVCHKNGIKSDDRARNLYWGTYSQNTHDSYRHGRNSCARLLEQDVIEIRVLGEWGFPRQAIADAYRIGRSHAQDLINRRRGWLWLK